MVYPTQILSAGHAHYRTDNHDDAQEGQRGLLVLSDDKAEAYGGLVEVWHFLECFTINCINGDTIVAHFAFRPQRKVLDKLNILNRYGASLRTEWEQNEQMCKIHQTVQEAMREVEERKKEISAYPNIYPAVSLTKKRMAKLREKIANWKVPILKLYTFWEIKKMLITMGRNAIRNKQHIK